MSCPTSGPADPFVARRQAKALKAKLRARPAPLPAGSNAAPLPVPLLGPTGLSAPLSPPGVTSLLAGVRAQDDDDDEAVGAGGEVADLREEIENLLTEIREMREKVDRLRDQGCLQCIHSLSDSLDMVGL